MYVRNCELLSDILRGDRHFSLIPFLEEVIEYGKLKIKCDGGSVYFFSGANEKLELVHSSYGRAPRFYLAPGEGIAGRAFDKKDVEISFGDDLANNYMSYSFFPKEYFKAIIAMPVEIFDIPYAVFCFDFCDFGTVTIDPVCGPPPEIREAIVLLWKEIKSEGFGLYLHQLRMHHIRECLRKAGESPANLKFEVSRFITNLQEKFKKSGNDMPDLICVQLVDHQQKKIQTIQSVGMPLSYEFSRSIPLASNDIHADILNTRNAEVIVGNDENRFDQLVFKKYHHEKFVRMFIPLFPFPFSSFFIGKHRHFEDALRNMADWYEESRPDRLTVRWKDGNLPPKSLVFGTLEIGYERKDRKPGDFSPWNEQLVFWTLAQALRLCDRLYRATISGVLDQIGRLMASIPGTTLRRFSCDFPDKKERGVREFPSKGIWPWAVPKLESVSSVNKPESGKNRLLFPYGHTIFTYTYPFFGGKYRCPEHFRAYLYFLIDSNAEIASKSVDVALRLNEATILPYDFLHLDDTPGDIGTLFPEKVMISVCEEASVISGAKCCRIFRFENEFSPYATIPNVSPPVTWAERQYIPLPSSEIVESIHEVGRNKRPKYERISDVFLSILPLEMADRTLGILVMELPESRHLDDELKRKLEGFVVIWVHRISMRRLLMRRLFSDLMANIRKEILDAGKMAEAKSNPEKRCLPIFIREILKGLLNRVKSKSASLTIYNKAETGPSRIERYWCTYDYSDVEHFFFLNTKLKGPCNEVCQNNNLFVIHERSDNKMIQEVVSELQSASKNRNDNAHQYAKIVAFANHLKGGEEPTTLVTVPVAESGDSRFGRMAALTLILPGTHFFDSFHQRLILEAGGQIAKTMRHVRYTDQHKSEDKHRKQVERRRKSFEEKQYVDDIIGELLKGMGGPNPYYDKEVKEWNFAEDVVIWNLDWFNRNLILRSGRGDGLKIFENDLNMEIIQITDHPLLIRENIESTDKKESKRLENFRLWTFFLEDESEKSDLCSLYYEQTGKKLLVSFPIVDATYHVFGLIDCLRDEPFPPEEETVLNLVLYRLSRQLCAAVEKCHILSAKKMTDSLYSMAESSLRFFQTEEVYQQIVRRMKNEFQCEICDLFLEHDGEIILHSTTRSNGPKTERDRSKYLLTEDSDENEILGTCLKRKQMLLYHKSIEKKSKSHMSVELDKLLDEDIYEERMAFPLKAVLDTHELIIGIIHLRGPIVAPKKKGRILKKSAVFTTENLRYGRNLCLSIQRIVRMAKLVEQQGWMITELVHSMGQPLHVLWSSVKRGLRELAQDDENGRKIFLSVISEIRNCFREVISQKEHIGYLPRSRLGYFEYEFEKSDLTGLIKDCCNFMAEKALEDNIRIEYSDVMKIADLPFEKSTMRKALINLLDNACKYSWSHRFIRVRAFEADTGKLFIIIKNAGIGIPANDLNRIFEPYARSRVPDARGKRPGTGVGLAIVREVIEKIHEGKVTVMSTIRRNEVNETDSIVDKEHITTFTVEMCRHNLERKYSDNVAKGRGNGKSKQKS